MDSDGFYKTFIHLDNFVPITYEDLISSTRRTCPYMGFIEHDLVYKNSEKG